MQFSRVFPLLFSLILLTVPVTVPAQLDPDFGTGGVYVRPDPNTIESAIASFLLPDGKILTIGATRPVATSTNSYRFIRFNANGSVDTTYGTNGVAPISLPADGLEIRGGIRLADGKIVMYGAMWPLWFVARVNADGTPDTSFSDDGVVIPRPNPSGLSDEVTRVALLPDGKLLVGGTSTSQQPNQTLRLFLAKYETNGSLDTTFGDQSGYIIQQQFLGRDMTGLVRQSTGKFVAMYTSGIFSGGFRRLSRFNADGTLDTTFASPNIAADAAQRLLILGDDKLLAGGRREFTDTTLRLSSDMVFTRFTADGPADASYGPAGARLIDVSGHMDDYQTDMTLLPDGSVVAIGYANIHRNRAPERFHYSTAAHISPSGDTLGRILTVDGPGESPETVLVRPDGKVISVGTTGLTDIRLTRLISVPLKTYRFHAIPFELNSGPTVVGVSQRTIYRPSTNQWYAMGVFGSGGSFGLSGDIPVPSDYFSTLGTDVAVFRPSNGVWYFAGANPVAWGTNGDIPVPYDYEGDGKSDVAVFRPSNGTWYIRHGSDGSYRVNQWGTSGDKPVTGDYDGDGLGDLAVWRPSTGTWYITRSSEADAGYTIVQFGLAGDIPVQEDYDGDLKTDIAIFRPSTGTWYIWRSSDGGFTITAFGLSGDIPVPADYDGDRKMDIAVLRSTTWYQLLSATNTVSVAPYGLAGDMPWAGRY